MRLLANAENGSRVFATSIVWIFVVLSVLAARADAAGSGGHNAAGRLDAPYLILVSIDGFRWDYPDLYDTPALHRLADAGVRAGSMRPVYPSLTFPNHYSIATGLWPADHGIVHNHFPNGKRSAWYHIWDRSAVEDGTWYGGEPIWVSAEKHGLVSAAYYFVGTEAAIGGVSPSHWHSFDESVPAEARVAQVIEWLQMPAATRPHMVTLYFEDVDDAGHGYGQGSPQLAAAVERVDAAIGRLLDAIEELDFADRVNVLVVSDHGQTGYSDPDDVLVLEEVIDVDGLEIVAGGSYAWIFLEKPDADRAARVRDAINASWSHGRAYLRAEAPDDWRISENERFPDVFVAPDIGYGVIARPEHRRKLKKGDHGWEPRYREMHGVFILSGPRVRSGARAGELRVVDVYPLMLDLLEIGDGRAYELERILVPDVASRATDAAN